MAPEQYTNAGPEAEPDVEKELDELLKGEETREPEEEEPDQETGEVTEDQVKLAWGALSEREQQRVLRGVLHFDSFQSINKNLARETPGDSIGAKTRRHALHRMTAIARLLKTGDPRIAGVLNEAKALAAKLGLTERDKVELRKNQKAKDRIGARIKAERQELDSLMEAHAERFRASAKAGAEEGEIAPEAPEGPEVFSRELWEHLYAVGFDCIEMPAKEGKEKEQEYILYVDPANPNLPPELKNLFHLDENIARIQQQMEAAAGDEATRDELKQELERAKEMASWEQAQKMVRDIVAGAFQERINQNDSLQMKKKLTAVRQVGIEYPTQIQGREILKRIKPSFPDHAIVIYKQKEPVNEHQLMSVSRTGDEIRTKDLPDQRKRPMYSVESNTKLFPVMLKISMTREHIERMQLGRS